MNSDIVSIGTGGCEGTKEPLVISIGQARLGNDSLIYE
jgi:hypothetical protein